MARVRQSAPKFKPPGPHCPRQGSSETDRGCPRKRLIRNAMDKLPDARLGVWCSYGVCKLNCLMATRRPPSRTQQHCVATWIPASLCLVITQLLGSQRRHWLLCLLHASSTTRVMVSFDAVKVRMSPSLSFRASHTLDDDHFWVLVSCVSASKLDWAMASKSKSLEVPSRESLIFIV